MDESKIGKCSLEVNMALEDNCRMKVHAGPGLLGGGKKDPEVKFILDNDFSSAGNIAPDKVASGLETCTTMPCVSSGAPSPPSSTPPWAPSPGLNLFSSCFSCPPV